MMIYGRYFGLSRAVIRPRIEELLDFVQLNGKRDEKVDRLSGRYEATPDDRPFSSSISPSSYSLTNQRRVLIRKPATFCGIGSIVSSRTV